MRQNIVLLGKTTSKRTFLCAKPWRPTTILYIGPSVYQIPWLFFLLNLKIHYFKKQFGNQNIKNQSFDQQQCNTRILRKFLCNPFKYFEKKFPILWFLVKMGIKYSSLPELKAKYINSQGVFLSLPRNCPINFNFLDHPLNFFTFRVSRCYRYP